MIIPVGRREAGGGGHPPPAALPGTAGTRPGFPGATLGLGKVHSFGKQRFPLNTLSVSTKCQKYKWEVKSHFYKNICFELNEAH